jgi:4-hydroxymandelate oxidase
LIPPDELERRAREVLPADVFAYFAGGSGRGHTLAEQELSWRQLYLRPRILNDVSEVATSVSLLGHAASSPVVVAPSALHGLAHSEAEVATARGTSAAGCRFVLSMRSSSRIEDVAATGPFWQQIYVLKDRGVSDDIAIRAAELGATALMLTVDTPYVARKAAGIPQRGPASGIVPALDNRDEADQRYSQAADLTPDDLSRLAQVSGLPVIAKGVLRGDDAVRCVEAGAAAIVVSTHGGRQLDGAIPVPYALPEVVDAVGDRAEVYADGGIRTGVDVVRALALGARAVMIGRPVIWALATGGAPGVQNLLTDLNDEVREALALSGCVSSADAGRDLIFRANF